MDTMDEDNRKNLLLWAEKAAIENIKAHHASTDIIAKEAATTLTVFLAAMGGGFAFAMKALDSNGWTWLAVGASVFAGWFLVLSALLVTKCLKVRALPPMFNEPDNLYMPQHAYLDVLESELKGFQRRIEAIGKENGRVVRWLNGLRLAAVLSPAPTALAAGCLAWSARAVGG